MSAIDTLRRVLDERLFEVGGARVTLATVATVFALLIATVVASRLIRRAVERFLASRGGRPATVGTAGALLHYSILVVGLIIALKAAGLDLTALFAAGAIFAVGLAFAMQSIAQNFVAGVILLGERSIKPGDIIEVEEHIVEIKDVGIRATVARARDGEELIIPNSILVQTTVKNYTLRESSFRIRVPVGVVYASDMAVVRQALEQVAREMSEKWAISGGEPQVFMTGFGNHSVNFEVAVWIGDPWKQRHAVSDLHEAIWGALRARGIVIAFPQLDVHLDAPVVDSIRRLAERAA